MGSIYSRKNKKGSTWYIQYRFNGEQVKEKVGPSSKGVTRKQAVEALKSREGDIIQGRFNIAQTKKYPTFNKLMNEYLDWSETHKRSYERDISGAKHLKPFFGKRRINEITPFMIEQYKKKRRDHIKTMSKNRGKADRDISFTTVNRELALLKHFYSKAIEWGKIEHNPVKGVRMFPEKERERYLTEEEIAVLLNACDVAGDEVLKMMVVFALNTGARLGEILNLKVSNLDFKNRLITFVHTKCEEKGRVPMNECLRTFLKEHLKDHKYEYVICKANGEPYSKSRIGRRFRSITDIAGIKNFRFHDLRHTFASHLVMQGVDLITLQKLGRWKSYEMVLRYTHLSPSHNKNAIDKLGGIFTIKKYERNKETTGEVQLGVI